MSAPKTNLETQKRRHIVPLIGIGLAALFGVVLVVYWQFEEAARGASPMAEEPAELPLSAEPPEISEPGAGASQAPLPQD
jgi:hypothetical protein